MARLPGIFLFSLLTLGDVSADQRLDVALHIVHGFQVLEYVGVGVLVQVDHISAAGLRLVTILGRVFLFLLYCLSPRFLLE